uniref:Uncharacterized protein n=1 Tax=Chenopodium quinoa TaxID=63459 RepID=A0A803N1U0_CHEQI
MASQQKKSTELVSSVSPVTVPLNPASVSSPITVPVDPVHSVSSIMTGNQEAPDLSDVGDTHTPPASPPFSPLEEGEEPPHSTNWKHVNRRVVEVNAESPLMKERMGSIEESLESTRKMQVEMPGKMDNIAINHRGPSPHAESSGEVEDLSREIENLRNRRDDSFKNKKLDGKAKVVVSNTKDAGNKPVNGDCYNCRGPHFARDCPKKGKLGAMGTKEPIAEDDEVPIRVNPIGLLNAVRATTNDPYGGLMYVDVHVNGHDIKAMVDTGATHKFVSEGGAKKLDLPLSGCTSRMKAMNSDALVAKGRLCGVNVQVGSWKRKTDLIVVTLDDFELILGNKFIHKAKASVMPHLGRMLIGDEDGPCFVKGVPSPSHPNRVRHDFKHNLEFCSDLQVRSAVAKGQPTFLAALVEISPDKSVEVPDEVAGVLDEFKDVMPLELPKNLPSRHAIDHKIDLELGALPLTRAPNWMSPGELAELRTI